jgi:uncharacterized alkaline shock family protein YloU
MMEDRVPGRSLVTRRAIIDIIRPAVVGSYGVTGLVGRSLGERLLGRLGLAEPGINVSLGEDLTIDLYLTVAYGLPVAEVARQADSAVRYALRRALAREVDRLAIHVGGTSYQPASAIAVPSSPDEVAVAEETGGAGVGEAVMAGAGHADDRA